jgi:uncharacterized protein (DUF2384 family)
MYRTSCAGGDQRGLKPTMSGRNRMRLTIDVDEKLYRDARALLPTASTDVAVIEEALKVFVRSQAAKRLADTGGTSPDAENTPRRKPVTLLSQSQSTLTDAGGMRIAQVIVAGIEFFEGDYVAAASWITTCLAPLGGRRPIEMSSSEELVEILSLLGRLEHGVFI